MPESRRHASRRARPQIIRHAHGRLLGNRSAQQLVRNVVTGRILPCCYGDCERHGDNRYQVQVPHNDPKWRDERTGRQEMLVYIFCSPEHKALWVAYYKANERGELTH